MIKLVEPTGYWLKPEECDSVGGDMDRFLSEIDGPYYVYGPNDEIFTGFELGKKLVWDGFDYEQIKECAAFTSEMKRGYDLEWKKVNG